MVSGPLLGARAGRTVVLRLLADSNLKNFRWHGNRLGNEIGGHLSRRQELSGRTAKSSIAEGKLRQTDGDRGRHTWVRRLTRLLGFAIAECRRPNASPSISHRQPINSPSPLHRSVAICTGGSAPKPIAAAQQQRKAANSTIARGLFLALSVALSALVRYDSAIDNRMSALWHENEVFKFRAHGFQMTKFSR